jgi:hypothetical protein
VTITAASFATTVFAAPYSGLRERKGANTAEDGEQIDGWAGAVVKSPPPDQGGFLGVIAST